MNLDSFHSEEYFSNLSKLESSNREIKVEDYFEHKNSKNFREQEMRGNNTYELEEDRE